MVLLVSAAGESVAIVVVTYNSAALLADLIASLPAGLGEVPYHLIFADNASADDSVAVARRLAPAATVLEVGRNAGYAAGINAGLKAAGIYAAAGGGPEPTAILILNPDVRLAPGCVPALIAALRQPHTGLAVPRLVDRHGVRIDSQRREPALFRTLADALLGARRAGRLPGVGEVVTGEDHYRRETFTDWAEGSTLLVSAECWRACGPWDESYFLYSEETDFALRARDAGFGTRYTPNAHAVHLEGESGQSPALWALLNLNRVRLYRKRHGAVRTRFYWAVLVLREASRALLGKATSRTALRALLSPRIMRAPAGPDLVSRLG